MTSKNLKLLKKHSNYWVLLQKNRQTYSRFWPEFYNLVTWNLRLDREKWMQRVVPYLPLMKICIFSPNFLKLKKIKFENGSVTEKSSPPGRAIPNPSVLKV